MKLGHGMRGAVAAVAISALTMTTALADTFSIGAMRLGSSWYVFGATLAELLQKALPEGTIVEVVAKGGGVGNPVAVEAGTRSVALANTATSVWAMQGNQEVYDGKKHENIRALVGGLNTVWVTAMVRNEFVERTGLKTLADILSSDEPVRVVMKPKGSSVPVVADMILEAMGTSRAEIEKKGGEIIQVDVGQIPGMMRDGRADLYFESAVQGHPATTETSLTVDIRFLDIPDDALARLAEKGLNPLPMPEFFKGQSGPTKAVDLGTMVIAHKDLDPDLAYLVTKTIIENKDRMAEAHKAWTDFVPEEAWQPSKTGIPLHPGAERYYRERGWM